MSKTKTKEPDAGLFGGAAVNPGAGAEPQTEGTGPVRSESRTGDSISPTGAKVVALRRDPFLALIKEVSTNKELDGTKLNMLLDAQFRYMDRVARMSFDEAMVAMQPELPVITKDGKIVIEEKGGVKLSTPIQKGSYAKWETINPLIKPILNKHGFALTFRSSTAPDGRLRVTAILRGHGYTDDACYLDLAPDPTGNKNAAQAQASALSYGKRHTACEVLNIATQDEDDDARMTGKPLVIGAPLTDDEVGQLIDLCGAVQCSKDHFLRHMNNTKPKGHPDADDVARLPRSRFKEAVDALRGYEANKRERAAAPKS